ncbi:Assimilatory nitrite reductase [NAD(P)H] small subunit [Falsiruegeria mediterranea M17]|uniref:Assimilatory nitrite reductase [NAD(P)H] small subunit n=2 Tax=Falsiruegeria TaxID=2854184 RepID=A0A2R8CEY5_9RHOB|nr:Assimilatory nitrite reductase [NAD(P)H] small subunit [Falsiruegeria mediterranea M17]
MQSEIDMSQYIDIGTLEDIPQRGARVVRTPEGEIAVFRTADDQIFAIDEWLPGKAGPLSNGIQHGTCVTDPMRNWVFDLRSGVAQGADDGHLRVWDLYLQDGRIFLTSEVLGAARVTS